MAFFADAADEGAFEWNEPIFTSEDDKRNAALLESTLERSTRKRLKLGEDFDESIASVETTALRALQVHHSPNSFLSVQQISKM
jgi:hypothetical protein